MVASELVYELVSGGAKALAAMAASAEQPWPQTSRARAALHPHPASGATACISQSVPLSFCSASAVNVLSSAGWTLADDRSLGGPIVRAFSTRRALAPSDLIHLMWRHAWRAHSQKDASTTTPTEAPRDAPMIAAIPLSGAGLTGQDGLGLSGGCGGVGGGGKGLGGGPLKGGGGEG